MPIIAAQPKPFITADFAMRKGLLRGMECLLAYSGKQICMKPEPRQYTMYYILTTAVALAIIIQVLIKINQ